MAQWWDHFLFKHEDLSLKPSTHIKTWVPHTSGTLVLCWVGKPLGFVGHQPSSRYSV